MYFIQEKKVPNILLVGLCGVQVILARYNTFVDLNNLVFNNKIMYVINSVVGATVIILILKNLNVKSRFLRYCGSNSLIIFATHGNLIYLFRKYINTNMHGYISGIGLMILIMLMEVPFVDQLSKKLSHMHRYLLNVLKLCLHCQMQDCLQGLF